MTRDEWHAIVNAEFDALAAWWEAEFEKAPKYGDMMRREDADRLQVEHARRLEAIAEKLLPLVPLVETSGRSPGAGEASRG
jgi:hypothetical protein